MEQARLIHNNGGWMKKIRSLSEDLNIKTNNYTHIPISVVLDKITQKNRMEKHYIFQAKIKTFVKFKLV